MSRREWKPGDVAVAAYPIWGGSNRETTYEETRISRYGHGWARLDNPDDFCNDDSPYRPADPRPLVVIDPEDREQVGRLIDHYVAEGEALGYPTSNVRADHRFDAMQVALREFAEPRPPKPDEPKDYLAVALTRDGKRYWRWSAGTAHTSVPWRLLGAVHADTQDEDGNFRWADLDVVEIVSDGVGL